MKVRELLPPFISRWMAKMFFQSDIVTSKWDNYFKLEHNNMSKNTFSSEENTHFPSVDKE